MRVLDMPANLAGRGRTLAQARIQLQLLMGNCSWTDFQRTARSIEKEFVRLAESKVECREVVRRLTIDRLYGAIDAGLGWKQFGPMYRRADRLGYSNLLHRHQVASSFVLWSQSRGEQTAKSIAILTDLERRVLASRNTNTRARILASIRRQKANLAAAIEPRSRPEK